MIKKIKALTSLWPLFLIAFLSWYSYVIWLEQKQKGSELSNSIEAQDAIISSKVSGRIKEILIEEGATIKQGQVLIILEGDELIAQHDQAKYTYEESLHQLTDLKKGARPQEIAQSEAQRQSALAKALEAKVNLENKVSDFEKMERLYADGAISKKEIEKYKTEKDIALQNLYAKRHDLKQTIENENLLKDGPRKDEVRALNARTNFNMARLGEFSKYVSELTVTSPIDGEVSSFDLEVGEYIQAGKPIATITNLNDMYVRVYIPSTQLSKLKINTNVNLKADSYPGEVFKGRIKYISSKAEFTPRNIQTAEERSKLVYQVKVEIDNKDNKLRDGMYITVTL